MRFPEFEWSLNPARLGVRALRFTVQTATRVRNRRRFKRHEQRRPAYSIINDECHHYGTMLYYISLTEQRCQLKALGFEPDAAAYDEAGRLLQADTADSPLAFIARVRQGTPLVRGRDEAASGLVESRPSLVETALGFAPGPRLRRGAAERAGLGRPLFRGSDRRRGLGGRRLSRRGLGGRRLP